LAHVLVHEAGGAGNRLALVSGAEAERHHLIALKPADVESQFTGTSTRQHIEFHPTTG
jgi:hypothetical protein